MSDIIMKDMKVGLLKIVNSSGWFFVVDSRNIGFAQFSSQYFKLKDIQKLVKKANTEFSFL